MERNEEFLISKKHEKESFIEKILNKLMEPFSSRMFEDVTQLRNLILLPSITDILKQSKFTDHEINIIKNLALEKIHRQRILKEYVPASKVE